jgi:hypothetical protein
MPDEPDNIPDDERDDASAAVTVEWKAPASKADLDKIVEDRLNRERRKFKDYDTLKEKAARADALDHELASETEKAVRTAREEAEKSARTTYAPRLVRSEFRAQAKGVLSGDQLDALLEDLDLSRYVDGDGDVDVEKVERKVAALAPAKEDRAPFPDLGGGRRGGAPSTTDMNVLIRRQAGKV